MPIFIKKKMTAISVGQPAPGFALYNTDKQKTELASLRGKNVLLLFFPQAFTSVCTKELCGVRDNYVLYNDTDAVVLGISVDSVFTLARFKAEQQFNFQLLSDFNKEASTAYGCIYHDWILDMKGVSKRAAFLIDREGIVRYAEVLENAGDVPDFQAIHEVLGGMI
ncbi:MAG TPA: redoxin domain-containing protein [Chitinophagaceae bacterium]|nr:redoxin domain-containing protein [Chitinophagaceae bacterium]